MASQTKSTRRRRGYIVGKFLLRLPSTLSRNERMVLATETPAQSGRAVIPTQSRLDRNPSGYPWHSPRGHRAKGRHHANACYVSRRLGQAVGAGGGGGRGGAKV